MIGLAAGNLDAGEQIILGNLDTDCTDQTFLITKVEMLLEDMCSFSGNMIEGLGLRQWSRN